MFNILFFSVMFIKQIIFYLLLIHEVSSPSSSPAQMTHRLMSEQQCWCCIVTACPRWGPQPHSLRKPWSHSVIILNDFTLRICSILKRSQVRFHTLLVTTSKVQTSGEKCPLRSTDSTYLVPSFFCSAERKGQVIVSYIYVIYIISAMYIIYM